MDRNCFTFNIYRKLTATDSVIPQDSCHPIEQKLRAMLHLQNKIVTYPTDEQNKCKQKQIVDHILHNNHYSVMTLNTWKKQKQKLTGTHTVTAEKWAKFMYMGGGTRFIIKLFKKSGLHTAFTTKHNTNKLLTYGNNDWQNKYEGSGVFQLTCLDCNKNYIGLTDPSVLGSRYMFMTINTETKNQIILNTF
jgi:hypothetical protein